MGEDPGLPMCVLNATLRVLIGGRLDTEEGNVTVGVRCCSSDLEDGGRAMC